MAGWLDGCVMVRITVHTGQCTLRSWRDGGIHGAWSAGEVKIRDVRDGMRRSKLSPSLV